MKLTGVGGIICAAHTTPEGGLHGHTYEVVAWYRAGHDAVALRRHLDAVLASLDHAQLPDEIRWGEELAEYIHKQLPGCISVDVNRHAERLYAKSVPE